MAPLPPTIRASSLATSFREQWINPGNIFNVLLLLGGDIVGKALAQLAGSGLAPVAFSFGKLDPPLPVPRKSY